jgi:hypothetical protein
VKSIPNRNSDELLISRASSQTFAKTAMKTRPVNSVVCSTVQYTPCISVAGSGARNVISAIMKSVLGS